MFNFFSCSRREVASPFSSVDVPNECVHADLVSHYENTTTTDKTPLAADGNAGSMQLSQLRASLEKELNETTASLLSVQKELLKTTALLGESQQLVKDADVATKEIIDTKEALEKELIDTKATLTDSQTMTQEVTDEKEALERELNETRVSLADTQTAVSTLEAYSAGIKDKLQDETKAKQNLENQIDVLCKSQEDHHMEVGLFHQKNGLRIIRMGLTHLSSTSILRAFGQLRDQFERTQVAIAHTLQMKETELRNKHHGIVVMMKASIRRFIDITVLTAVTAWRRNCDNHVASVELDSLTQKRALVVMRITFNNLSRTSIFYAILEWREQFNNEHSDAAHYEKIKELELRSKQNGGAGMLKVLVQRFADNLLMRLALAWKGNWEENKTLLKVDAARKIVKEKRERAKQAAAQHI